jgi:hypothetical protein
MGFAPSQSIQSLSSSPWKLAQRERRVKSDSIVTGFKKKLRERLGKAARGIAGRSRAAFSVARE